MAFAQDVLTRTINVHWGGGIFVVKNVEGALFTGSGKTWVNVGSLFSAQGDSGSGSSFAKIGDQADPVFVVSIRYDGDADPNGSRILASSNGIDWERVFSQAEVDDGAVRDPWIFEPNGIVWEPVQKRFFASFYTAVLQTSDSGATMQEGETIYSSADGVAWGFERRTFVADTNGPSALAPYCIKPENAGGIPDGLQGFNGGRLIKPTGLKKFTGNGADYGHGAVAASVMIKQSGEADKVVATSAPCYAVGQFGGSWVAVGGETDGVTVIDGSSDGEKWERVFAGGTSFGATASGGQKKTTT